MQNRNTKRTLGVLALPLLFAVLSGCSGQPAASTTENQKAREAEAQEKLKNAYQTDPTLQKPDANRPSNSGTMSPGPVPGQGGMSPGPIPGQGH